MFRLKSHKELQKKPRYRKLMIILKVQPKYEDFYELVEVSRHNLEESIKGKFNIATMICNKSKDAIVLTVEPLNLATSHHKLIICNVKLKIIEQIVEVKTTHSHQKSSCRL